MYQIITFGNETYIQRSHDHACIPTDPANADYQAYLSWQQSPPEPAAD